LWKVLIKVKKINNVGIFVITESLQLRVVQVCVVLIYELHVQLL